MRPNWVTEQSTLLTSRSTRGRKRERVERHAIAPQRGFGLDAADDVVPVVLVEVLSRLGDELMQVEEMGGIGRGVVDVSLWDRSFLHGRSELERALRLKIEHTMLCAEMQHCRLSHRSQLPSR